MGALKGKKKTKEHIENMKKAYNSGRFKKGISPWNKDKFKIEGGCRHHWYGVARKTLEERYNIKWENMYKPNNAVVHHINGNFKDNRFDNLCVMSNNNHTKLHHMQGNIGVRT